MFNFLTKNRKGFTLIELLVVLVLLSFGVLALANMFKVTYRAFQKAEERSMKQEAVKTVAEILRSGSEGVCSAITADIFNTTDVVPKGGAVDKSYSYLYCTPSASCKKCGANWNFDKNYCSKNNGTDTCDGTKGPVNGYFVCVQDKGKSGNSAEKLSEIPMYINISVEEFKNQSAPYGVNVELAALEEDFVYKYDNENKLIPPTADDIYYSLKVAYHFPNMATKDNGFKVNHTADGRVTTANKYNADGSVIKVTYNEKGEPNNPQDLITASDSGIVLRVYCDSITGNNSTDAAPTIPSMCFIATASYGQDSGEVGLLCKFRDECLLTNPLGTAFVKAYYKLSPPIADFIRESEPLKAAVRFGLKPLVAIATNALDEDAAAQNAPWFIMFMLCGAGATATLIKVDKRRKKAR